VSIDTDVKDLAVKSTPSCDVQSGGY